jgi:hypothetical protein
VEKTSCSPCGNLSHQFDASASSSYSSLGPTLSNSVLSTQYGDGSSYLGALSNDVFSIGDSGTLSVAQDFVLVATDSGNSGKRFDGRLGLGLREPGYTVPTLLETLNSSKLISQRVFALYLNTFSSASYPLYGSPSSNLMIGGYDLATYSTSGSIEMTLPVRNTGYWEAIMTSFSIDGVVIQPSPDVFFDSGTTGIAFDATLLAIVHSTFTASTTNSCSAAGGNLVCSCSKIADLMPLTLEYNGKKLWFNAETLWTMQGGKCTLNIDSQDNAGITLGDYFLSSYYVIYDVDSMTISFATAVSAKTTATSWAEIILLAVWASMII